MTDDTQQPRRQFIKVRVNSDEKASFEHRSLEAGLTVGDYIRRQCLDMQPLRKRRTTAVKEKTLLMIFHELAQLRTELHRQGNNINQIAYALNSKHPLELAFIEKAFERLFESYDAIEAMAQFVEVRLSYSSNDNRSIDGQISEPRKDTGQAFS